jgi:hypothetical protein
MSRVIAVVEGVTEQRFVREILAPYLGQFGIWMDARLVGKPGHKGGVGPYPRAKGDILAVLKTDPAVICTTMFDYYAMPSDWPGCEDARRLRDSGAKASAIENALGHDIVDAMGTSFHATRFRPYIQMHEFEALLYSDIDVLLDMIQPTNPEPIRCIETAPEEINDTPSGAPSRRILAIRPGYNKVILGYLIVQRIGLDRIRAQCHHFNQWLTALEALAR